MFIAPEKFKLIIRDARKGGFFRGREIYLPPRYMTCAEAAGQLLEIARRKQEEGSEAGKLEHSLCVRPVQGA